MYKKNAPQQHYAHTLLDGGATWYNSLFILDCYCYVEGGLSRTGPAAPFVLATVLWELALNKLQLLGRLFPLLGAREQAGCVSVEMHKKQPGQPDGAVCVCVRAASRIVEGGHVRTRRGGGDWSIPWPAVSPKKVHFRHFDKRRVRGARGRPACGSASSSCRSLPTCWLIDLSCSGSKCDIWDRITPPPPPPPLPMIWAVSGAGAPAAHAEAQHHRTAQNTE